MSWLDHLELQFYSGYIRIREYIPGIDSPKLQGKVLVLWAD